MKHKWNPWIRENWSVPEKEWNDPALPMISLGVLNYNRCAELRQTLDVLTRAVQYPNYEIIVIDNGSTDGSIEMVRSEYPQVQLHEVGQNLGVSARNIEFDLAKGKYLFMFDDDTCPGTPVMVLRIVQHMEKYLDIDALSTSYYQPKTGVNESHGWEFFRFGGNGTKGFESIFLAEGGVCFRTDGLRKVGGYDPAWPGAEGAELALQMYSHQSGVYFCPWFLTLHFISPSLRAQGRSYRAHRAYVNSRQNVWLFSKHWPILAAIPLLVCLVTRRFIAMLMHPKTIKENILGLKNGFQGIYPFLKYRPKLTWKQVYRLKRFYIALFRWA